MANFNVRVTEVNDLSKDGRNNRRVVLEAKSGQMDGTGPQGDRIEPFRKGEAVTVRLEIVMDTTTQGASFPMGSVHSVNFSAVPSADQVAENDAKVRQDANRRGDLNPSNNANVANVDRSPSRL